MKTPLNKLDSAQRKKLFEFLASHPIGVLATINADGSPHASTIYINVDEDLRITFTTKHETQKYQNISQDNRVMLAVYDAQKQTAVQVGGEALEVTDPETQQQIYHGTLHAAKQTGTDIVPPIAKIAAGSYVGFVLKIDSVLFSDYGWGDTFAHALKHANDPNTGGDPA